MVIFAPHFNANRAVAQGFSVQVWGTWGRRFKSAQPDFWGHIRVPIFFGGRASHCCPPSPTDNKADRIYPVGFVFLETGWGTPLFS
jgi:hypothetical protein